MMITPQRYCFRISYIFPIYILTIICQPITIDELANTIKLKIS